MVHVSSGPEGKLNSYVVSLAILLAKGESLAFEPIILLGNFVNLVG